jgi:hypothetical protein
MDFPKDILIPPSQFNLCVVRRKPGSQKATPSRCARATVATRTDAAPALRNTRLQARAVALVV